MRSDISTQVLFELEGSFNRFSHFCNMLWLSQGRLGFWGRELRGFKGFSKNTINLVYFHPFDL